MLSPKPRCAIAKGFTSSSSRSSIVPRWWCRWASTGNTPNVKKPRIRIARTLVPLIRQPPSGRLPRPQPWGNGHASILALGKAVSSAEGCRTVSKQVSKRLSIQCWTSAEAASGVERDRPLGRETLDALAMYRHIQLYEPGARGLQMVASGLIGSSEMANLGQLDVHPGPLVARTGLRERVERRLEPGFSSLQIVAVDGDPAQRQLRPPDADREPRVGRRLARVLSQLLGGPEMTREAVRLGQKGREPALVGFQPEFLDERNRLTELGDGTLGLGRALLGVGQAEEPGGKSPVEDIPRRGDRTPAILDRVVPLADHRAGDPEGPGGRNLQCRVPDRLRDLLGASLGGQRLAKSPQLARTKPERPARIAERPLARRPFEQPHGLLPVLDTSRCPSRQRARHRQHAIRATHRRGVVASLRFADRPLGVVRDECVIVEHGHASEHEVIAPGKRRLFQALQAVTLRSEQCPYLFDASERQQRAGERQEDLESPPVPDVGRQALDVLERIFPRQ